MSGNNQSDHEAIIDQAAHWHIASAGDNMDWEGFAVWLEADLRHRACYDEIALIDSLIGDHAAALRGRETATSKLHEPVATPRARWPWAIGAVAAVFAAILVVPTFMRSPETVYATGATDRAVTLADGSTIMLAPRSKLVISGNGNVDMRLTGGAFFDIRHNPGRHLAIAAGQLEIRDIGTSFDVQATGDAVRVAVTDGQVESASSALAQPIRLTQGHALLFDPARGVAEVTAVDTGRIGTWRQGRLVYESAPLTLVATDLGRYAGIHLEVPANLKDRRFSGMLAIADAKRAPRDLAQIMGLALVRGAHGPVLSVRPR